MPIPTPASDARRQAHVTTDPRQIRALAHPVRLALLDHLGTVEEATATECAEAIGESVASCSFHLRSLAQHGYIEPGERAGRSKPWRKVHSTYTQQIDPESPGSDTAVAEMARLSFGREADRLRHLLAALPDLTPEDANRNTLSTSTFYVTNEELAELRTDLLALAERFAGRARDPRTRPNGARQVHLLAALTLDLDEAHRKDTPGPQASQGAS
ncbi:winged helix-turn-helix domain-containing protein [Zhihengliuella flava]|uniref:DNA-binding transcriptional ArsR family regulator n=1 Tax=Zhihengliuella flava TaxID=1285193 RepID=A0A931D7W9_9MICC|nr:helix-turn-helix domain-containing protein [Zhihengliuella flava]MBG6084039.1 DNA-binding transcriptional ArsR family regulator [Zhihengliuella flava]